MYNKREILLLLSLGRNPRRLSKRVSFGVSQMRLLYNFQFLLFWFFFLYLIYFFVCLRIGEDEILFVSGYVQFFEWSPSSKKMVDESEKKKVKKYDQSISLSCIKKALSWISGFYEYLWIISSLDSRMAIIFSCFVIHLSNTTKLETVWVVISCSK